VSVLPIDRPGKIIAVGSTIAITLASDGDAAQVADFVSPNGPRASSDPMSRL